MEPFELYLVRHAIAAERGPQWPDDAARPLTEAGVARFREAVRGLDSFDGDIEEVFTSPLLRARQTANLLAHALAQTTAVKTLDALAPGHRPRRVLQELAGAATSRRIALVGHEPGMGELAAHLLGSAHPLSFRKGAVCRISVPGLLSRRPGTLVWFLPPKVLRRLRT